MKKILVISDSHGHIDKKLTSYITNCDIIIHCGDWGNIKVYESLLKYNKIIKGVFGNIDASDIRLEFPEYEFFEIEGFKILITHIAKQYNKFNANTLKKINEYNPNLIFYGHSHILEVKHDKINNYWYFNPGAIGNEGIHLTKTALRFDLDNKKLSNFEIINFPRR